MGSYAVVRSMVKLLEIIVGILEVYFSEVKEIDIYLHVDFLIYFDKKKVFKSRVRITS